MKRAIGSADAVITYRSIQPRDVADYQLTLFFCNRTESPGLVKRKHNVARFLYPIEYILRLTGKVPMFPMKRLILLLCTLLALNTLSRSQSLNIKLDSLFNVLERKDLAMASIAIARNGKVIYKRAIGSAHINGNAVIPANENTTYRIGSISKMFTAVIVFQLIEEKKLSLNDTLAVYFPQLPNAGHITIQNLLNHRSGLPDYTKNTDYLAWMDKSQSHDDLLARIYNRAPDFEPGTKADYNNSNYLILGFILEKVLKKTYDIILQERIIAKLALTKTYYGKPESRNADECDSYKYTDSRWTLDKKAIPDNFGGAGAIISTPTELTKFIEALFAGKLISNKSLHAMTTLTDDYGMGTFPYTFQTKKGFGHNGKTEGFASSLVYYPEDRLTIAYLTNGEVYPKADILNGVLSIVYKAPYTIPSFVPQMLNDAALDQYPGTYTSDKYNIKVVCTKANSILTLETNGKTLPLDALGNNKFMNPQFGFFFEFNPGDNQLIIQDGDDTYYLKRQ